ncbi:MAG: RMD1 family protein [Methylococcaceae bacterium]|nr:RMD1 family protein [Methylococcaceae bacterium]
MFEQIQRLNARAWFIGSRIDLRELSRGSTVALGPLTMLVGQQGYSMIFRFGVVVMFGLSSAEEQEIIEGLKDSAHNRFEQPECEAAEIFIDPNVSERLDAEGRITLREASVGRLQVVAHVLAKSCVLSYYENSVAEVFDRIEVVAERLCQGQSPLRSKNEILGEIGNALLIQTRTVGRVEITEKPEIVWEEPELDRLYERIATEYELRDRDLALSRKLDLVSRTAETYLDLVNNRQTLRVEWYIVILIVVEILLSLYGKFF